MNMLKQPPHISYKSYLVVHHENQIFSNKESNNQALFDFVYHDPICNVGKC